MKNKNGRLTAFLITVMVHFIAGIIFMSIQLRSLQKTKALEYEVELASPELPKLKSEKTNDLSSVSVEKVLKGDEEMLNIARNLSAKPEEKVNASDYVDQVKNELIKSGKLGVNNFIDDQKKSSESKSDDNSVIIRDSISDHSKNTPSQSQIMASRYKGPTRIYYDLYGRNHVYLPIPIYKCQGSGTVVLTIQVDQNGDVQKAQIVERESTVSDPCLIETAINTALISRFNADIKSPKIQIGMLTYQFVAQ